ncbi:MAG TPA: TIGR01777 family oxidoreductase [Candidatus Polarisedimenticolaceae bacterium]|nr:TIGR01777 family oxidoreductase [Candidatus Polarisedimenticolaceae bacterium]
MPVYVRRSSLPVSRETAFAWHTRPGALERLVPPWQRVEVLQAEPLAEGSRTVLRLHVGPLHRRWVAQHHGVVPPQGFTDVQVAGPFRRWEHAHRFHAEAGGACALEDRVDWDPPRGMPAAAFGSAIDRAFAFRHLRLAEDLRRQAELRAPPQRIAITGASGLIGSALVPFLTTAGHRVDRIVRGGGPGIPWDPRAGTMDSAALDGVDAVVHLAGENIGAGRWTPQRKRAILESRVRGTGLLVRTLASLPRPPRVLVAASAVGFYGNGAQGVDEQARSGSGFLAEVVRAWEDALLPAEQAGVRVVRVRTGVVLSVRGGMLARVRLPFLAGLGGPIASGKQFLSWIALDDLLDVFLLALTDSNLKGPVNAVAPEPTTNRGFTAALARVLRRPAVVPLPAFVVRAVFGEMGEELLLSGQAVRPARLESMGFRWRAPALEQALARELGAWPRS